MITRAQVHRHPSRWLRRGEKYEMITRMTTDALWDWDIARNVLEWDDGFITVFGYPREEIQPGLEFWSSLLHPEDAERVNASLDTFTKGSGQTWEEEYRFRKRDGSYAYVLDRGFIIRDKEKRPIRMLGAMKDVTERKLAEEKLSRSERRFRALVENLHEAIVLFNARGEVIYTAPSPHRVLGYEVSEVMGRSLFDFIIEPDRDKAKAAFLESLQRPGQSISVEVCALHRDGNCCFLEGHFQNMLQECCVEAIVCTYRDVTERKKAQEERERLSAIVENSSDFVGIATDDQQIVYLNAAGRKMIGLDEAQDIRGYKIGDFHPDWAYKKISGEGLPVAKRDGSWSGETAFISRSGREIPVSQVLLPHRRADGQIHFFSTVARDISVQKKAEEEIRELNEQLERRVQLRTEELEMLNKELETFSYSVSHDLRAPVRAIQGFSEALAEDFHNCLKPDGMEYVQRIQAAANRMEELISDLLSLARVNRQRLEIEEFDLAALMREVSLPLQRLNPRELVLPPNIFVKADKRLLRVAVENLLGNAWKFTGKSLNPRIEAGSFLRNGKEVYFIRDNGIGFNMAFANKLFLPFERLHRDPEIEGTGVGLATVQRIIKRHGGEIWAEGRPNEGAVFYFTLERG